MKGLAKIIMAVAAVAALCVFAFGCGNDKDNGLRAPNNLRIEDDVLLWDEVGGADGYLVDINGKEYDTTSAALDIFLLTDLPGTYNIRVSAVNDVGISGSSKAIEYTVDFPACLEYRIISENECEVRVHASQVSAATGKLIVPERYPKNDGSYVSVTKLSDKAFENCKNLTGVILPSRITEIPSSAFSGCENLTRVSIPDSLEVIGSSAFTGCKKLKHIDLPISLNNIGGGAFSNCTALEHINIPILIRSLGYDMFLGCENINITVAENNAVYQSDGNCVVEKKSKMVICGGKDPVIPDYAVSIGDYAFSYRRDISALDLPEGLKSIGTGSFFACENLIDLILPSSLESIGNHAFNDCTSLCNIVFAEGLETLGLGSEIYQNSSNAFEGCDSLKKVVLPKSLGSLDGAVFGGCHGLTELSVDCDNPVFKSDGNCIIRRDDNELVLGCDVSVIPDYVTVIGPYAFYNRNITATALPKSIQAVKYKAFCNCAYLDLQYLPSALTELDDSAFGVDNYWEDMEDTNDGSFCVVRKGFPAKKWSVVLSSSIETVGANVLMGYTVFTDAVAPYPNGWNYLILPSFGESGWLGSARVINNCTVAADESGTAYVVAINNSSSVRLGGYDEAINMPYRDGYIFKGWSIEEGSDKVEYAPSLYTNKVSIETYYVSFTPEQRRSVTANIALYAVWEKII